MWTLGVSFGRTSFADPRSDKAETRAELEALYQDTLKSGVSEQGSITWIDFGDDVEMLPIKALRIMQEAELVLFPKQCPYAFVDLTRRDAERGEYASDSELADKLNETKQNQLRIVVFVSPGSAQFNLLKSNDLHIKLGSQ